jgi:hypothetical protein
MKKRLFVLPLLGLLGFFLWGIFLPPDSEAMPFFSRKIGKTCTFCHIAFPKLNETGRIFRSNGYRFAENVDSGEWKDVKSWATLPLSLEVEVEGEWNSTTDPVGVKKKESDLKVEEVEIMTGGTVGKTGRISFLGIFGVEQTPPDTYESFIGPAFIQFNDILGPAGHGMLNARAGQWALALPFLGNDQRVVKNRYLAQRPLGVFTGEELAFEFNGSIVAPDESSLPTHRYSAGIQRADVNDGDKLRGFYGTYSLTFMEKYNIGAIYRHTEEKAGANDADVDNFGVAAEASAGPAILTLGFFHSEG